MIVKRRIYAFFLALSLYTSILFQSILVYSSEPEENELYAISAALIDGDTGRILYEKNGYEVRPMASTTKIMTLILALEYGNMDDMVTVSSYAAKMPDVQLDIKEGEQYLLKDLLYSLILESHNDVAVAIAEHIGGSVEGFARMMNNKADELGLDCTYFITPNGLDAMDENGVHSTNAVELSLLMRYCTMVSPMKEAFIDICQTKSHSFSDYEGVRYHTVNNKNSFLYMMDGVVAGKTGFTNDAGYCYTAALKKDGKTYIIALLGCGWPNNKNYKWEDSKTLFNYGIEEYYYKTVVNEKVYCKEIEIINGIEKNYIDTYVKQRASFLVCDGDDIDIEYNLPKTIQAPVKKDEIVGQINVTINGTKLKTIQIYSKEDVNDKDFMYYLNCVFSGFLF